MYKTNTSKISIQSNEPNLSIKEPYYDIIGSNPVVICTGLFCLAPNPKQTKQLAGKANDTGAIKPYYLKRALILFHYRKTL